MLSFSQLVTFSATSILLIFTPGPDIIYVLTRGMAQGKKVALSAAAGFALGNFAHTLFAIVGLSALVASSPVAFALLRYCGALYLAYLGIQMLSHGATFHPEGNSAPAPCGAVFRQSIIANVLNPKVALFFLAFFPQFVERERGSVSLQMFALGCAFVSLTMVSFGLVALCSGALGNWLRTRPGAGDRVGRLAGVVLIALALRLAIP